jgi:trigger factor
MAKSKEDLRDNEQTTDTDREGPKNLKINIRKGQAWTRFLEIEVPAEDVTSKFQSVYESFRSKAKISGFRPGKAPLGLVKQRYAGEIKAEVLDELLSQSFQQALIQEKLIPLGNPKVSDVEFDTDKPMKFKAEIEIRPEIKLGKHKGFRVEKKIGKVTEKDVDDSLEYLRDRMAEFHPVQRPSENGDLVIVDLIKKHDKLNRLKEDKLENAEIYLGSEGILEEFQRGLMGVRIGEMKDISVKYPDDYYDKNLAGDQILFMTVVKEIKRKILPELNDEFAARASKAKTLGELKEFLKKNLEAQAQDDATKTLRSEIVKRVVEGNLFDVPQSLLDRYLDSVIEDFKKKGETVDENTVRGQYRPLGENFIRWNYLYHEIARAEGLKVETGDRKKWVDGFSKTYNISEEKAREYLGKSGRAQDIDESILEDKVIEFIIKNSEVITAG